MTAANGETECVEPTLVMRNSPLPRMSRRGRVTVGVLVGVFLLFTLLGWGIDAYTDYLWFNEVDFTNVFTGVLLTRLLLFLAVGLAMALVIAANLYLAYRLRPLLRPHSAEQATLERYRTVIGPRLGTWITVITVIIGFFAGLSAQSRWKDWMLFQNSQPFGVKDPQFNVDVSFYVFDYPLWKYLLGVGFTTVVLSVVGALAVHYVFGGVRLQGVGDRMTAAARAHLTSLVAVFVLLKAVAYMLDQRALLLEQHVSPGLYGAGYTDVHALLPAKDILAYISIVVAIAIVVFSNAWMRNLVWPGVSLALLAISAVAIGGIYPLAVQNFQVQPSLQDKESPYIARSINATRAAFGLQDTVTSPYAAANLAPPADLATNASAQNVRLIDPQLVSEAFTQQQQVRGFYDFGAKLDVDRYTVDNATKDYVVGVREVNDNKLTAQQQNWLNRHTVFTHGYGLVAAPANQVVCGGLPYFVSGFLGDNQQAGCASATEDIKVDQPRIYYGRLATTYAIVGSESADSKREYDTDSSSYSYTGSGGVKVGNLFDRLVFATNYGEANFLFSSEINDKSKIMYYRDPVERVKKAAPFLTLDTHPYPAVVDGRIVWIVDAYTTAQNYPYSQSVSLAESTTNSQTDGTAGAQVNADVSYIRNSVKATVDAYTGEVTLYSADDTDPMLKAWEQIFPNLIKPSSAVSTDLRAHFRYPQDLFEVQRELLTKYHVDSPVDFFQNSNYWDVPTDPTETGNTAAQPPYYQQVAPPNETNTTFQLTSALTIYQQQFFASFLSASSDPKSYGKLTVLQLPQGSQQTPGPVLVQQAFNSNQVISNFVTTRQTNGRSQVIYGNLLTLPTANGLLYIEPLYIRGVSASASPQLGQILVWFANRVGSGQTLADALAVAAASDPTPITPGTGGTGSSSSTPPTSATVTSPTSPATSVPLPANQQQALDQLNTAYQSLLTAKTSGDFVKIAEATQRLQDATESYLKLSGTPAGSTSLPTTATAPGTSAGG